MKRAIPRRLFTANETELTITVANEAVIWFKGAENPDGLFGEDVYAAVMDEGTRCKEESWHAVRSTLTATQGPIRIIGNVKGRKNWAYHLARKAEAGAPDMAYFKLTAWDAVEGGVLAREEIEDAERVLPPQVFRELYLAEPSDDGGNPFGLTAIAECAAFQQRAAELGGIRLPAAWGWDLAKSVDYTVGTGLASDGLVARFDRWQKPWQVTVPEIIRLTAGVPAAVDSTGVGDPILEQLQANGRSNFEGYHFSSPSKQQLMEGLALAIQKHEVGVLEGPMRVELEEFEYLYTRTGVRYSAPEGQHDDCVMSLALAVYKRSQLGRMASRGGAEVAL